ncbi:MAG TPA: NAD(P)H-binding protein [Solirubrobacter sp.]
MSVREPDPILITGATGYVGGQLVEILQARGHAIRTLSRRGAGAGDARTGDVLSGQGLPEALEGAKTAYYLVHSMGAGGDFAAKDRQAAVNFAEAAANAGVERVIYLGGLGSEDSEHLRSRHEVATLMRARLGARLVYVRAAMIIGPGSASYDILEHLVKRLPVMIVPRWLDTKTQPIALSDVVRALADVAERDEAPDELQLGGSEVLTYREMMRRAAPLMGRRPPLVIRVPVLTPRLSSYWVALVTPVSYGLIKPLVDGLGAEMIVDREPPAGLNDQPLGFEEAVKAALG